MKVGDLVHAPRYPFWGMGVVIEVGRAQDGLKIHWLDNHEVLWVMNECLKVL